MKLELAPVLRFSVNRLEKPCGCTKGRTGKGRIASYRRFAQLNPFIHCSPADGLPAGLLKSAFAATAFAAALAFGTRFVDIQRAAVEVSAVQRGDGVFGFVPVGHFDESESARLSGHAISDYVDALDSAVWGEKRVQIIFGGLETQVSDEYIGHFSSLAKSSY
jgi:hypothetical protein